MKRVWLAVGVVALLGSIGTPSQAAPAGEARTFTGERIVLSAVALGDDIVAHRLPGATAVIVLTERAGAWSLFVRRCDMVGLCRTVDATPTVTPFFNGYVHGYGVQAATELGPVSLRSYLWNGDAIGGWCADDDTGSSVFVHTGINRTWAFTEGSIGGQEIHDQRCGDTTQNATLVVLAR